MFQLIQYTPTTPEVYEIPLLIFPPWINKFYILDLTPEKSFIRWAVEQGLTVFVVSWKNADASIADATLDTYVGEGFPDRHRQGRGGDRRQPASTPSAIASRAPRWRRRSPIWRPAAGQKQLPARPSSPPRST